MSHSNSTQNSQSYSMFNHYKRRNHPKAMNRDNYNNFQYYSNKYNYRPRWSSWRRRPPQRVSNKRPEKERSKSPSSFSGTEEYMFKKIQEASNLIKKTLMTPESDDIVNKPSTSVVNAQTKSEESGKSECEQNHTRVCSNKKNVSYNMEEIHDKIITHITKLSHSKKMNLICAKSSGYDSVIQRIHKQKRLELSKALRDMCSNQTVANSEIINSIIPDIGIKIEELPVEMIQELSNTLDWNFEDCSLLQNCVSSVAVDSDVCDSPSVIFPHLLDAGSNFLKKKDENNFTYDSFKEIVTDSKPEVVPAPASDCLMRYQNDNNVIGALPKDESVVQMEIDKDTSNDDTKQEINEFDFNHEDCKIDIDFTFDEIKKEIDSEVTDYDLNEYGKDIDDKSIIQNSIKASLHYPLQNCYPDLKKNLTSVGSQTNVSNFAAVAVQTISSDNCRLNIDKTNINNLDDAIKAMHEIDNEIMRLTKLRQSIFSKVKKNENKTSKRTKEKRQKNDVDLNGSLSNKTQIKNLNSILGKANQVQKSGKKPVNRNKPYKQAISFENISEKVLVIKLIENTLLAATETGNILYINPQDGSITTTIKVSQAAITALHYWVTSKKKHKHLFVGSLDTTLHEFNFDTKESIRTTKIKHSVQCLEMAWFFIFIGTTTGNLLRYSLKQFKIEFEENISQDRIMVLKAAQEGARRILLVGTKNTAVCIRDAMSGLHLRTLTEFLTPTVYSLILEKNMVYCGTTYHDLLVYNFHDGNLVHRYEVTNSKGICCMKIVENLLFASCHDGNVYVYNIKHHKFVGTIPGPGGGILSMEVVKNIVIVGTMSLNFKSLLIPESILDQNEI